MKIVGNEKGMALMTALLLGLAGIAMVSGVTYMATNALKISSQEKKYSAELEVARGVAEYVMAAYLSSSMRCGGATCSANVSCPASAQIDIPATITDNFYGSHTVTACALGETSTGVTNVLSASVVSENPTTGEKARIEFVYKVE